MGDHTAPVVGILSIGDMGLGIGRLLISQGYRVVTFAEDRSDRTRKRAQSNGIELLPSIRVLAELSDCLLSIVPPRDALATAQRVVNEIPSSTDTRKRPLYYVDLNAISPGVANQVQALCETNPNITLIDGGIIGGVPYENPSSPMGWYCPSVIVSGPTRLPYTNIAGKLNMDHMGERIGAASGLKMCFASTTKGLFAIAIQSYVTAGKIGVLPQLRDYMRRHNPDTLKVADKGVTGMPPKAYRWVNEMQQIGAMMEEEGGFDRGLFDGVAEVYRIVAEDTVLGLEQPGERSRGTTVEDVVEVIKSGMSGGCKE
ncbi:6-phosphogluconate dehydrogenase [Aspergillus ambiguus]|uniref:6-phosphogluconate dehydrogenase n=1 Tax=Aspergillus ambiguus TaxID=176160 RepID=UPI003CCCDE38